MVQYPDMKQNRLPISGIDTDAKWGYSKSKGWIFGYKIHMSCSTGKLIVPLSADVSTANVHDGKMYGTIVIFLMFLVMISKTSNSIRIHSFC